MSKSHRTLQLSKLRESGAAGARPKMSDIARHAGVSEATVSRALNDSPLVRDETKRRVQDVAARFDYRVDVTARNLRLQRTNTIGLMLAPEPDCDRTATDPFFLDLIGGVADAVRPTGLDLLLMQEPTNAEPDYMRGVFDMRRADGVIVVGQGGRHDRFNALANEGRVFVVWGAHLPDQTYVTVGGANHEGGRLAAAHLIARGRRRIAFLGDTRQPEAALRHTGYVRAHADAKLTCAPALLLHAPFTSAHGHQAVSRALAEGLEFDAIVAASDGLALAAIAALTAAGRSVPDDVAITGYDDVSFAAYSAPPLTTVRQDVNAGGRALVAAVMAMIEGETPQSVILPTELIVRASSG